MDNINFCGYLDNTTIANGFLIPIYTDGEKFFFQEVSKDMKLITGFHSFNLDTYEKDILTKCKLQPAKIGSESYVVVKLQSTTKIGLFSDMKQEISQMINSSEISSKVLISNASRIFNVQYDSK